jgi:hypothetical protein
LSPRAAKHAAAVPNNNASKFDLDKPARDAVLEGFQVLFHRANLVELTLSLGALVLVTGCNSKPAASDDMKQFRALGAIYAQYMATHQGKTPESNQKLQEFASAQGDSIRQRFNVAPGVDLFVSPRDGQPLTFVAKPKLPYNGDSIVAYESQGSGGMQIAVSAAGGVQIIPTAELPNRL